MAKRKVSRISREEALRLLQEHDSTIFGATNVKENGQLRDWNVRLHCGKAAEQKNITGRKIGANKDPFKIKVYEVGKRGTFRTLNLRTLLTLRLRGVEYQITNPQIYPSETMADEIRKQVTRLGKQAEMILS